MKLDAAENELSEVREVVTATRVRPSHSQLVRKVSANTMLCSQNKFEPALQTLVDAVSAKFSAAFKRKRKRHLSTLRPSLTTLRKSGVKCSGEVQVLKVEGHFAQWGIKILVSYRDIDRLKTLTGTHQSGGVSLFFFFFHYVVLSDVKRCVYHLSSRNGHLLQSLIS